MKKLYLLVLLFPFVLSGCELFPTYREIWGTYFVMHVAKDSNARLFVQSDKLELTSLSEVGEVTDERHIMWAEEHNLTNDDENFKIFGIHVGKIIGNGKDITIYCHAEVDDEIYTGNISIDVSQASIYDLNKQFVILKAENGNVIVSIFAYYYKRS